MRYLALIVLVLVATGCHPALISPEPLLAGDECASVGVVGYGDMGNPPRLFGDAAIQSRIGVGSGVDVGARIGLMSGLYADVKWNVLAFPFLLSADLGGSYEPWKEHDIGGSRILDTLALGVYPALLFGTRTLYGGVRVASRYRYGRSNSSFRGWDISPGILVGASFGDINRIMPGIEVAKGRDGMSWTASVNIEGHKLKRELP